MIPGVISFSMNSWPSKIPTSLALISACGLLNSCQLGAGNYSSQTEIETDVPESLEQGKASQGPPAGQAGYAANSGVPAGSNLVETAEMIPATTHLADLPGNTVTGGAPMPSSLADPNRTLIDIPRPDFASVSLHSPRTPANMISLDNPSSSARMSLPPNARPSAVVKETVSPLPPVTAPAESPAAAPTDAEIAGAPKVSPSGPDATAAPAEPGVPLLHSAARLSDFYAALHQPLLDQTVVENTAPPVDPAPAPDDSELPPPPPPGETAFGSPVPQ